MTDLDVTVGELDPSANGWDDLRMAIIKQALLDYKDGLICKHFLTDEELSKMPKNRRPAAVECRSTTIAQAGRAIGFFRSEWCDMVRGDVRIRPLVEEVKRKAVADIKLLSAPTMLFRGKKGKRYWVADYDRLFDMARDIFPKIVVPMYILSKVNREDYGCTVVEFQRGKDNYFGVLSL